MMGFVRYIPLVCILLPLGFGVLTVLFGRMAARVWHVVILLAEGMLSATLFFYLLTEEECVPILSCGGAFRAGVLEAGAALFLCVVLLFTSVGGQGWLDVALSEPMVRRYYIFVDLLLGALMALFYTDGLFAAYVFAEFATACICGLILLDKGGRGLESAIRYLIVSLLGSGLLLLGISMLYDLTGELRLSGLGESVALLYAQGIYRRRLAFGVGLICLGVMVKGAAYPFHMGVFRAYERAGVPDVVVLSCFVPGGFLFLLAKFLYRAVGITLAAELKVTYVLFAFGIAGVVFCMIYAAAQEDMRRMLVFSCLAQTGCVLMGLGIGTVSGVSAAVFQMLSQMSALPLLFLSCGELSSGCGGSGGARTDAGSSRTGVKLAGVSFAAGACSAVGMPLFSGFSAKLLLAQAAVAGGGMIKAVLALAGIVLNTVFGAVCFGRALVRVFARTSSDGAEGGTQGAAMEPSFARLMLVFMVALDLALGCCSRIVADWIEAGLGIF